MRGAVYLSREAFIHFIPFTVVINKREPGYKEILVWFKKFTKTFSQVS
jgi:hypothetical protein